MEAFQVSTKVARVGFEWPDAAGVLAKLEEETRELREEAEAAAPDPRRVADEVGDLLFTAVNVARAPRASIPRARSRPRTGSSAGASATSRRGCAKADAAPRTRPSTRWKRSGRRPRPPSGRAGPRVVARLDPHLGRGRGAGRGAAGGPRASPSTPSPTACTTTARRCA